MEKRMGISMADLMAVLKVESMVGKMVALLDE
jgi:hypothetical protein